MEYFRKELFFTGSKFSIEVVTKNTSTIVSQKDSVHIEHRQYVEAEIELFEPSQVLWAIS